MVKVVKKDKKLIRRWIEALRSGKYAQSKYSPKDSSGFCCLGVVCSIVAKEQRKGFDKVANKTFKQSEYIHNRALASRLGFNPGNDDPTQKILSGMNDKGRSFNEIADYIEKNLL